MNLTEAHAWPSGQHQTRLKRPLTLSVPFSAVVQSVSGARVRTMPLTAAQKGQKVKVWTTPSTASLKAERGDPLALEAALVLLSAR